MEKALYHIYRLCIALVAITESECCMYGFEDEINEAYKYIKEYEKDHPEVINE